MKTHSINPRACGTNSATNAIMAYSKQPAPRIGMGATILMWTDRHAGTIVGMTRHHKGAPPHSLSIQQDKAMRTDSNGMSESQDYAYAPDPSAAVEVFTLRANGAYVKRGESMRGTRLVVGERDEYHDFSF